MSTTTHPTIHPIRQGDAYVGRCSTGPGVILRRAHYDGLRVALDDGDVVFSAEEVRKVIDEARAKGRQGTEPRR